ncbi:MAG: hypothetical protein HY865_22575 [Chloroflexi bacterium]|nr:hypothetical protein [Chloroflexota bacterium]
MADDQNTAAQAVQSTPPAEGSETSQTESQVQTQSEEVVEQPGATSENQIQEEVKTPSEETEDQSGQEAKPTRVERRINSLLSKVKEVGANQTQQPPVHEQPLVTQEEREQGVVDPNLLEQRIQSQIDARVQKALQVETVKREYVSSVKEHQLDLEGVKDIDPDLEAEAATEYEAINYQINPFTGQKEFVPAVKFSEIVSKIQSRAEKIAQKMAEKIAVQNGQFIKDVESSQAVPSSGAVSGSRSVKSDTTNFSEFEKQYSS